MTIGLAPRGSIAGFTLIEMLVAAALLSLLAIAVLGALRFSGTVWSGSEGHAARVRDRGIVDRTLRDLLTGLYPIPLKGEPAARIKLGFEGKGEAIEGSAMLPAAAAVGGYRRFRLESRMLDGGRALVLSWMPERSQPLRSTPAYDGVAEGSTILLQPIERFTATYFGRRGNEPAPGWHASWTDAETLPGLVRIEIVQPGLRDWPALVAQPVVTADSLCVFDRLSRTCPGRAR